MGSAFRPEKQNWAHQEIVLDLASILQRDRLHRARLVLLLIGKRDPLAEHKVDAEDLEAPHNLVVHLLLVHWKEAVARVDQRDALLRRCRLALAELEVRAILVVVVQVGNVGRELNAERAAAGNEDGRRLLDIVAKSLHTEMRSGTSLPVVVSACRTSRNATPSFFVRDGEVRHGGSWHPKAWKVEGPGQLRAVGMFDAHQRT